MTTAAVRLIFTGGSTKCYVAGWDDEGNGVVAWGAGTVPTQAKSEQKDKVARKVAEKLAKGYVQDSEWLVKGTLTGTATERLAQVLEGSGAAPTPPVRVPTVRLAPQLAEPMEVTEADRFIVDPRWVAEQKLDGDRVLVVVEEGSVTPLNRNGVARAKGFPPAATLATLTGYGRVVLDGELVGSTYNVFDVLEVGGLVSPATDWEDRRLVLEQLFAAWNPAADVRLVPVARTAAEKRQLHDEVLAEGGEGVMFKDTTARYLPGARPLTWRKCKFVTEVDVIVVAIGEDGHNSASVAVIDPDAEGAEAIVKVGKASLNGKEKWNVRVGDVVVVRYLSYDVASRRLAQCRLSGQPRSDKRADQCTLDQIRHTTKTLIK